MITARGKLDAKKLQCAANKTALDTKRDNQDPKGCNQLQHAMEIAQCSYAAGVQTEVTDYRTCNRCRYLCSRWPFRSKLWSCHSQCKLCPMQMPGMQIQVMQ